MPALTEPWWLIGLAVVPFIRWLHRRQAPLSMHAVSALFLWQRNRAEDDAGHSQQPPDPAWRRRALFIALLFIALAAPHLNSGFDSVSVWIDNSASMQTVENNLTRLAAGERLLDEAIQDKPAVNATRIPLPDRLPKNFDAKGANWLVTDGANSRVRDWARESNFDRVIQIGEATENTAITQLSVRRSLDDPEDLHVLTSISNAGTSSDARTVSLSAAGIHLQSHDVSLDAGQTIQWQTRIKADAKSLSVSLNKGDPLRQDDTLSLPATSLAPQRLAVAEDCSQHLRGALILHPALAEAPPNQPVDLLVTCSESAPRNRDPDARPVSRARIHIIQGTSSAVASRPVWLPYPGLSGTLQIPLEHLRISAWPTVADSGRQQALLVTQAGPLVIASQARDGSPLMIETVINFGEEAFARQSEYAGLVATLVDAAFGAPMLDRVARRSRAIADIVIQPQVISVPAKRGRDTLGTAGTSLKVPTLLLCLLIALIDLLLLVRLRRRAAYA